MWSENQKEILLDLKRTCLIHMFLQTGSAYVNNVLQNAITIPNIILGAILSITIFSSTEPKWKTASGVMAVISTILSSIGKQMGAGERAQLHCSVVRQYQALIRDINTNLLMPDMSDDEKVLFIRTTKAEIDKLFSIQPDASIFVIRNFEKKYHKHIEMVLYPEFSNMEEVAVRNANRISKRYSRYQNRPDKSQESMYIPQILRSGAGALSGIISNPIAMRKSNIAGRNLNLAPLAEVAAAAEELAPHTIRWMSRTERPPVMKVESEKRMQVSNHDDIHISLSP